MDNKAYTLGFLSALSEKRGAADGSAKTYPYTDKRLDDISNGSDKSKNDGKQQVGKSPNKNTKQKKKPSAQDAIDEYREMRDKENGVVKKNPVKPFPTTSEERMERIRDKISTNLTSLGKGLYSSVKTLGVRSLQNALLAGMFPFEIADMIVGRGLLGVDEGRGALGRSLGKINRGFDRWVADIRKESDDYDYANNIGGGFNRFMNGAVADVGGAFLGFGGIGALRHPGLLNKAFTTVGTTLPLFSFSREKQQRDREEMIRELAPLDRARLDPTSTPTNQAEAPTIEEYRRYHMPPIHALPATSKGYLRIPRGWSHENRGWLPGEGSPVQFRDFGT